MIYSGKDRITKVKEQLRAIRIKHKAAYDAMMGVDVYRGNMVCAKLDDKIMFPSHYENVNPNLIKKIQEDIKKEEGFHYLLAGMTGCGKTLMANIIAKTIQNIYGMTFRFVNAGDIYSEYLDMLDSKGSDKHTLLRKIRKSLCHSCIIFDDIGDEKPDTDKAHEFIGAIVSARYNMWQRGYVLFSIDTTNHSGNEIRMLYGDRVTNRLLEMNLFVHMEDRNFRDKEYKSIKGWI